MSYISQVWPIPEGTLTFKLEAEGIPLSAAAVAALAPVIQSIEDFVESLAAEGRALDGGA